MIGEFHDRLIDSKGVSIATRDYGGRGAPILLIHGFGRNLEDWSLLVPYLVGSHRVLAMDLRSHGQSGDGPWTWSNVIADVSAVASAYQLGSHTVVGHSLGGKITPLYAQANPACAAIVNLDGHGRIPSDKRADMINANMAGLPNGGEPFPSAELDAMRQAMIRRWLAFAISPEVETAEFNRSCLLNNGQVQTRPDRGAAEEILEVSWRLDVFAAYRRIHCCALVFNATATNRDNQVGGLSSWAEFHRVYENAIRRDLSELAAECPNIAVEHIEAGHYPMLEQPQLVAQRIGAFVGAAA